MDLLTPVASLPITFFETSSLLTFSRTSVASSGTSVSSFSSSLSSAGVFLFLPLLFLLQQWEQYQSLHHQLSCHLYQLQQSQFCLRFQQGFYIQIFCVFIIKLTGVYNTLPKVFFTIMEDFLYPLSLSQAVSKCPSLTIYCNLGILQTHLYPSLH